MSHSPPNQVQPYVTPFVRSVNRTATTAGEFRTAIGAGTSSFDGAYASLSGLPTLGTAAATAATDYATAAQGATADTAVQPARVISAGTGLSGGGDLSADRTLTLANTAVTAGSYTAADITVDAHGRITAAANGSGGGDFLPLAGGTVTGELRVTGELVSEEGAFRFAGDYYGTPTTSARLSHTGVGNSGVIGLHPNTANTNPMFVVGNYYCACAQVSLTNGFGTSASLGSILGVASGTTHIFRVYFGMQRIDRGLSPASQEVCATYTSGTSFESVRTSLEGGQYVIASTVGSAGGNNHDIVIGHRDSAGTLTTGLTVDTSGKTTIIPPTTDPGIAGALWNNAGTLAISAG